MAHALWHACAQNMRATEMGRMPARKGRAAPATARRRFAYRRAMRWLRFAVLLLPLLVAGCGRVTDSEQLRLCRLILPVLHPGGHRDPRNPRRARARSAARACASTTRRASRARPSRAHFVDLRLRRDHVRARPARPGGGRDRRGRARRGAAPLSSSASGCEAEREGVPPPSPAGCRNSRPRRPTRCSSSSTRSRSRPSMRCSRPPIR